MIEEWTARREAHTLAEKAREEREQELLSVQAAAKAGEAACLADIPPSLPTIGALRQEDAAIRADIRRLTDELDAVSRRRDELTLRRERFLTARDEGPIRCGNLGRFCSRAGDRLSHGLVGAAFHRRCRDAGRPSPSG